MESSQINFIIHPVYTEIVGQKSTYIKVVNRKKYPLFRFLIL